jgi:hypothetical protein
MTQRGQFRMAFDNQQLERPETPLIRLYQPTRHTMPSR